MSNADFGNSRVAPDTPRASRRVVLNHRQVAFRGTFARTILEVCRAHRMLRCSSPVRLQLAIQHHREKDPRLAPVTALHRSCIRRYP